MTDRYEELKRHIKRRKVTFCTKAALLFVTSISAIIVYILFFEKLSVFLASLAVLVFCVFQMAILMKNKTVKIFGKERRGVILSKGEEMRVQDDNFVGGVGFRGDRVREFSHDMRRITVGTLYIKGKDGKIFHTRELNEDQTEFYKIGDEVVLLAGATFPIVLDEPESNLKWLCPICGKVSPDRIDCSVCGLEFK